MLRCRSTFLLLPALTGLAIGLAGCGGGNFESSSGDPFGDLGTENSEEAAVEADMAAQEAAMNN
ncbi:MAG: hypothetical protein WBC44_06185 [Planctomycetaceae bacterium]